MKKSIKIFYLVIFVLFSSVFSIKTVAGEAEKSDTSKVYFFTKKELNSGMFFSGSNEREELNTDESVNKEELFTGMAGFRFENRIWNFLSYKQEFIDLTFDVGPFFGVGNWRDSSSVFEINGDEKIAGLRAKLGIDYSNRFYYDYKNYTLVEVNAWVRNDLYFQKLVGSQIDSTQTLTDFNDDGVTNKFRYGFQAKAGWGFGKLIPMNHYMVADYIFENNYKGRLTSVSEIEKLANKITEIKQRRDPSIEYSTENELKEIAGFLRSSMLLTAPEMLANEWELGEFMPRLEGKRFEFGPFFNYYNREPDFYYGGFARYDNAKYVNVKWNRNFKATLNYNHYKHHNWASLETNLGWSYYPDLKSQFGFGLKYIPGMVVHDWNKMEKVKHNFVPYVEYYTQVNRKTRVNLAFAWKLGNGDNFMMTGPEFSLAFYRSRY